jgi:hypothetical protein
MIFSLDNKWDGTLQVVSSAVPGPYPLGAVSGWSVAADSGASPIQPDLR